MSNSNPLLEPAMLLRDPPIMVMLIDDQAMVGEAVRRLLADQEDMDLHYCASPIGCVEQANQIKPTVILLDLVMPQVDGLEVLRLFRSNPATVNVPIVVLSTTEDPQVKSQAFAAGANDYLVKLPNQVELIARIRYHSKSYLNLLQRDEAYRSLRESQQQLLNSNTALTALNEAFVTAKEEAEQANRAKSDFLSRMSHELRTPLNAILGFAQILEMGDLDTSQRQSVQHILDGGQHLLNLINEVLDIARIEAGRLDVSMERVRVSTPLREALELVRPLATQRQIELDSIENRGSYIMADRQRLKQVLLNLLSNAVKYNCEGGRVTVSYAEAADGKMRIEVSDTGPGIARQDLSKLFTPFERLGAERSGIEGTGIGLALSKRLVELMDGSTGVESTVGQGSTFWIELPLADGPAESPESVDKSDVSPDRTIGAACTVLYIEDNLANLKLIEHILARQSEVNLHVAMQGSVGLDLAREHHPDLILLDLQLPDISGLEVLRQLKENPATRGIPVVMISADATPHQIERLRGAGAIEYLTKPLDVKRFLSVLDENLPAKAS